MAFCRERNQKLLFKVGSSRRSIQSAQKSSDLWALCAQRMGNKCPSLGLSMPIAWSLTAHLTGKTDHLMVSYRTAYVILFLIQLIPQFV